MAWYGVTSSYGFKVPHLKLTRALELETANNEDGKDKDRTLYRARIQHDDETQLKRAAKVRAGSVMKFLEG